MLIIYSVAAILAVLFAVTAFRLRRSLTRYKIKKQYTASIEAPSVSVCIPARNETHAMAQSLERVLASDYKKIEIIVFDDSSADDTSVLVKSFAHAGVRFVPGTKLPEGWLGKNHALEVLAREASGTYIVFMDVDTHIKTNTISELVGYCMSENLDMVGVIPRRSDGRRASVLFGHLRYFWQLVLSSVNRPAVSSAVWMIKRAVLLDEFGGFAPASASVEPERNLATALGTSRYHTLVSSKELGVSYEKRWSSQVETSKRLLFPMLNKSWIHAVLALVALTLLNLPFIAVISGVVVAWSELQFWAFIYMLLSMAVYATYTYHTWDKGWFIGALLWPIVVMQEFILLVRSLWGYATHTVTWKGRSVTAPSEHADAIVIDK